MFASLKRFHFRVSLGYCILAILWIILSESALHLLYPNNLPMQSALSVFKGILFVAATTLILFAVLRAELRKRDEIEAFLQSEINESARTLEALKHAENRFETIFHGSPVATGISRRDDGHIIDVNNAFVDMFGYKREEVIGRTTIEVGLWANPEKRSDAIKAITETGSVRRMELFGCTKSGKTIQLLASIQSIDLGDEVHGITMLYDITEQRKLEEQIHYQALLLSNVSDAVISTDVGFNIRTWNPAAEAIYGWKAEEVIGKPAGEILQGEYPHITRQAIYSQLQAAGVWRGEGKQRHKDGSWVHMMASTSYVYDREGHHIGVVSVNRDVTALIKAQQEKQAAEHLRRELDKQTELLRLKEEFISIVSHEFRTPLTVIAASSELVLTYYEQMPAERRIKHFQVILEQARFMTSLLNDVLTINRARAGKLEFNPMPLDLIAFCQETLERIEGVDKGKHNFVFTHEGELSNVRLDVKLLQHILVNLLSNAVKYSPDGGDVNLDVVRRTDEIVLRVSDQGIGIPAESLPRLYEPFYRAKNTGDIGGSGLGTAIVKESVDFHNGTIRYESEVGEGTTVTVSLPLT